VDEESSYLTTFWTPSGRNRWKRVPFGITSAPEISQRIQHEIVQGVRHVESMADDILVYGTGATMEEAVQNHNECLRALLIRLRANGLKLTLDKAKVCETSVNFYDQSRTCSPINCGHRVILIS
jgi:hypothetical protein